MKAKKLPSVAQRLAIFVSALIFVSTVVVGAMAYVSFRSESITYNGDRAKNIAQGLAAAVSPELFETSIVTGEKGEDYDRAKQIADQTAEETNTIYLYVLDANYGDEFTYLMEGLNPAAGLEELDLGDTEDASIYADEMFDAISTKQATTTGIYRSGEFGDMVSGFAPILDSAGNVVGVVGADISMADVSAEINAFGLRSIIVVAICCLAAGAACFFLLKKYIGAPLTELESASAQLAEGDLDINLDDIKSNDEIGRLATSFNAMVESTGKQVEILERIADGDLSMEITARGEKDNMSFAMQKSTQSLNELLGHIRGSAVQLASASSQLADGSQLLSQGAIEQNATMDGLSHVVTDVADKAQGNVAMAQKATDLVQGVRESAEQGSRLMENMLVAVKEIDEASQEIAHVIKAIEEIASQTNILALNAAVEAARAGEHGKGFAVVADEVRNLAGKSAESSKETGSLVDNSIEKTALGVRIANETAASFEKIVQGIQESGAIINAITESSGEQSEAVLAANENIEQMQGVVHQNSASAEESAAASEELNSQSEELSGLLARFRLREGMGADVKRLGQDWT